MQQSKLVTRGPEFMLKSGFAVILKVIDRLPNLVIVVKHDVYDKAPHFDLWNHQAAARPCVR
jgi:hypothetical protein